MLVISFQAATKKQKYEKISEKKMATPVEVLCKVRKDNVEYVNPNSSNSISSWRSLLSHYVIIFVILTI